MNKLSMVIIIPIAIVSLALSAALLLKFYNTTSSSVPSLGSQESTTSAVSESTTSATDEPTEESEFETELNATIDDGGAADFESLEQSAASL